MSKPLLAKYKIMGTKIKDQKGYIVLTLLVDCQMQLQYVGDGVTNFAVIAFNINSLWELLSF